MRSFILLFPILIVCLWVRVANAEHLPVKTYTVSDGLLRDTVYKIKQDSGGFLWFCTAEGVSRFDGYSFTNFTVADGLPDGQVNDFLETKSGTIYLATDDGLARLAPAQTWEPEIANREHQPPLFTVYRSQSPQARKIQVLFEDENGTIWAGTSAGLYRLNRENQLEAANLGASRAEAAQISVTAIIKDRGGAMWVGTEGSGLFRVRADGKVRQFIASDGLPGNLVASLLEDREGNLWAGMRLPATAGLVLLDPAAADAQTPIVRRSFSSADGLPVHWIGALYQAGDGRIWLGTTAGLCEWQGADAKSVCRTYTAANDLCDKDVWSVAEDKDGNLWTGSKCGAKKWARYGFTTYGEGDGIEAKLINSIFENRAGELFAVIRDNSVRTIYRFDGGSGKFTSARPRLPAEINYFGWGWKQTVWQDSAGAWLVPNGLGLFRFPPQTKFENLGSVTPQKFSPATKGRDVFRVYEDSRGDIWIATTYYGDELWRWERRTNVWHDLTAQIIPAPHRLVSSFVEDQSGNLWIGTGADEDAELIRYRDGQFRIFTTADGLPGGWIRDLYVDHAGRLWIANAKNGLLRLDDVNADNLNLVRYSTAEGLSSAGVRCLTEDAFGRIYIGGARGIDRLNPVTGLVENFTTADGLPSSSVEVAYRDQNNNLWFGTENGLTRYVPEPVRQRRQPTTLLMAWRVSGEPQAISILGESEIRERELNSDQRQVSIDFVGLGASLGESLRYEYRLNEGAWTPTSERTVNFANLAAGAYQFEVRAATADRVYSQPASLAFRIQTPVYLRPWFLLLAAGTICLLGFWLYRRRVSRLLEMERVRTRIATDLHDDIGANLTRISILSEVANQRLGTVGNGLGDGNLLENIAETSRESISAMSDIVWAINPRQDSLADLTRRMRRHAAEILEQQDILLRFDSSISDLRVDANVRRNIYLIFKESLNNILRHSCARIVQISFHTEADALVLEVTDDGIGFETSTDADGNGLISMQKRAAELGGQLEIISRPGNGAIINLRVPVKRTLWTRIAEATRQNRRDKK